MPNWKNLFTLVLPSWNLFSFWNYDPWLKMVLLILPGSQTRNLRLCVLLCSPAGEGNGNPLQLFLPRESCGQRSLGAAVHRVAQSRTQLKWLSMHACVGEGNGSPLQYSYLENPRNREAWWAAVYEVAQSCTWLKQLSSSSSNSFETQPDFAKCSMDHKILITAYIPVLLDPEN